MKKQRWVYGLNFLMGIAMLLCWSHYDRNLFLILACCNFTLAVCGAGRTKKPKDQEK